MRMHW